MEKFVSENRASVDADIKARLQTYGPIEDETLIEYAAVLLENGTTKEHFIAEIEDFTGDFTQDFADWLYRHLEQVMAGGDNRPVVRNAMGEAKLDYSLDELVQQSSSRGGVQARGRGGYRGRGGRGRGRGGSNYQYRPSSSQSSSSFQPRPNSAQSYSQDEWASFSKSDLRVSPVRDTKSLPRSQSQICRYGHRCNNSYCAFVHPRRNSYKVGRCKFGDSCTNPKCIHLHGKDRVLPSTNSESADTLVIA
eukprot:TRINITY_DN786_c0_g3_i1.p1 TRINITY_DN786_c0_g3~~TRINITY_DN786_c0_g3_i1.p1  ORF type:complete len:250 (+),score=16.82 TRINITY_DN786_c0_g3_i1:42-791(+)